jgi:hypothetical protein
VIKLSRLTSEVGIVGMAARNPNLKFGQCGAHGLYAGLRLGAKRLPSSRSGPARPVIPTGSGSGSGFSQLGGGNGLPTSGKISLEVSWPWNVRLKFDRTWLKADTLAVVNSSRMLDDTG